MVTRYDGGQKLTNATAVFDKTNSTATAAERTNDTRNRPAHFPGTTNDTFYPSLKRRDTYPRPGTCRAWIGKDGRLLVSSWPLDIGASREYVKDLPLSKQSHLANLSGRATLAQTNTNVRLNRTARPIRIEQRRRVT